jgi:hypothetical protein
MKGNWKQAKCRYRSNYSAVSPMPEEIKRLRSGHLLELGKPFNEDTIAAIRSRYTNMITEDRFIQEFTGNRAPPPEYEDEVFVRRIWGYGEDKGDARINFFEEFPELTEIVETVGDYVRGYYNANFDLSRITADITHHIPQEVVEQTELYSHYWHCDPLPTDSIKLFILLNEVGDSTGPFNYISQQETQAIASGFERKKDGVPGKLVEKHSDVKTFTGDVGHAMFCNTNRVLHRAGNPEESRQRDMLLIQFIPSASPTTPEDWTKSAQNVN